MLLADALRANTTLRCLQLDGAELWEDAEAVTAVLTALTAHLSLQKLQLINSDDTHVAAAVGAALGLLVAANAPALQELSVSCSSLGDVGLVPLVDALPRNTHLRLLGCAETDMSNTFVHDRFLPAIRANTSLRELVARQ